MKPTKQKPRISCLSFKYGLLLSFCAGFSSLRGQPSFLLELKENYPSDIIEDAKGGLVVGLDGHISRYSAQGRLLWKAPHSPVDNLGLLNQQGDMYYFGSGIPLINSFEYVRFDIRGKLQKNVYDDPENETEVVWGHVFDSARKQFVVCGWKYWIKSKQQKGYWIAGVDTSGKILWEKTYTDTGKSRYWSRIFKNTATGGYVLLGNTWGSDQFWRELFNVDSLGNLLSRKPVEPNPKNGTNGYYDYRLLNIAQLSNEFLVATVIDPINSKGYLTKYDMDLKPVQKRFGGGEGISTISRIKVVTWGANGITVYNEELDKLWENVIYTLKDNEYIYIRKVKQSRDGGFYGVAYGERTITENPWVSERITYIFKTDSFGNINPQFEYTEKQQPMMLQPNPARNEVRVAIPYYFGRVHARYYDLYGRFLFEKTQNEQTPFDIRNLSTGIYIIKVRLLETGEQRNLKLVVE